MELLERFFDEILVFRPQMRQDCRGTMTVFHSQQALKPYAPDFTLAEQRIYAMPKVGTFFGIHHQAAQAKLVSLLQGRGIDYVVDLRKSSPTYRNWKSIELSGKDPKLLYIPAEFGHAFLSLEENTIQLFSVSAPFENGIGGVIHDQDPGIGLRFPMEPVYLSEYDRNAPFLE